MRILYAFDRINDVQVILRMYYSRQSLISFFFILIPIGYVCLLTVIAVRRVCSSWNNNHQNNNNNHHRRHQVTQVHYNNSQTENTVSKFTHVLSHEPVMKQNRIFNIMWTLFYWLWHQNILSWISLFVALFPSWQLVSLKHLSSIL